MKLFNKILIIGAAVFAVAYIGLNFYYFQAAKSAPKPTATNSPQPAVPENKAGLTLKFGDGQITSYPDAAITAGETAFDQLKQIAAAYKLEIKYKDYGGDMGVLVESIGGNAGNVKDNKFWQYYVNDKLAPVGVSKYVLKAGDKIEWRYEKANY